MLAESIIFLAGAAIGGIVVWLFGKARSEAGRRMAEQLSALLEKQPELSR